MLHQPSCWPWKINQDPEKVLVADLLVAMEIQAFEPCDNSVERCDNSVDCRIIQNHSVVMSVSAQRSSEALWVGRSPMMVRVRSDDANVPMSNDRFCVVVKVMVRPAHGLTRMFWVWCLSRH